MKNFILLLFIGSYFCAFSQTRSIEPERSVTTSHYVTVNDQMLKVLKKEQYFFLLMEVQELHQYGCIWGIQVQEL